MSQQVILLGFAAIFIGIILVIVGSFSQASKEGKESNIHVGVGGFIGPLPFGFASSREMLYVVIGLVVAMMLLFFLVKPA